MPCAYTTTHQPTNNTSPHPPPLNQTDTRCGLTDNSMILRRWASLAAVAQVFLCSSLNTDSTTHCLRCLIGRELTRLTHGARRRATPRPSLCPQQPTPTCTSSSPAWRRGGGGVGAAQEVIRRCEARSYSFFNHPCLILDQWRWRPGHADTFRACLPTAARVASRWLAVPKQTATWRRRRRLTSLV